MSFFEVLWLYILSAIIMVVYYLVLVVGFGLGVWICLAIWDALTGSNLASHWKRLIGGASEWVSDKTSRLVKRGKDAEASEASNRDRPKTAPQDPAPPPEAWQSA